MRALIQKLTGVSAIAAAIAIAGPASAQLTLMEGGYTVTNLGSSVGAKKIECSPGGVWGPYVYIADSNGNRIERVHLTTNVGTVFAPLSLGDFPVGLEFGPGPGVNFGTFLYVSNYGGSTIVRIDPTGTVFPFTTLTSPSSNTFDPTGAYSTDMFVTSAYTGPIYTVDPLGVSTFFGPVPSVYIRFGPGGAWGTGMYSTSQTAIGIVTVDNLGGATNFSTGFSAPEGFDWAFGAPFNGDMFATDLGTGEIWRITSGAIKTLWGMAVRPADVVYCNGCLYLVTFSGQCYKICPDAPVALTFSGVQARAVGDVVAIDWEIVTDESILGFNVYRKDASDVWQSIAGGGLLPAHRRSFMDENIQEGGAYGYMIGAVTPDGREIQSAPVSLTIARAALAMTQNFPNPFNPETSIRFTLPEAGNVTLAVYDMQGRWVVDIESGPRAKGSHSATWNGRNSRGEPVASGTYVYRLTAGSQTISKKLVLLK